MSVFSSPGRRSRKSSRSNRVNRKAARKMQERGGSGAPLNAENDIEFTPENVTQLQSMVGNQQVKKLAGQQAQRSTASLPPVRGLSPAGTQLVYRKMPPPRATIQRNPLQDAVAPHMKNLMLLVKKGGKDLAGKLGEAFETAKSMPGKAKDAIKYKYDMHQAKDKLKKQEKEKTNKTKEPGFFGKIKKYAFGSDFTFTSKLSDNLEDMPTDMAALQLQLESMGQLIENTTKLYRQSKGQTRKDHAETLETLRKQQGVLQKNLADMVQRYGKAQQAAILKMQRLVLGSAPDDVRKAATSARLDFNKESDFEALMDLYASMHPIEFRGKELEARDVAFKGVDESFMPLRNTAEGQLLSDTKKGIVTEGVEEMSHEQNKKQQKKEKSDNRFNAKIKLGERSKGGDKVTDEDREKANDGEVTPWRNPVVGSVPLQPGRGRSNAISGGVSPFAKKDKLPKSTDELTKDTQTASDVFTKIGYVTKGAKTPVGMMVKQISGGTQDDEGLLKAIPVLPALAVNATSIAENIILMKDGNSAQKKLGQQQMFDEIFATFNTLGTGVRNCLRSAEQFMVEESLESTATTTLSELGLPIVGIITSGAKLVKSAVDAGLQGAAGRTLKGLGKQAKQDKLESEGMKSRGESGWGEKAQSGALRGALKHSSARSFEQMGRSIAKGVTAGLALVGNVLTLTGVGAIAGESIKMITRGISAAQKIGEKVRDSYRTGKALESQYKAKVGVRGAENEVFELSPKYATIAKLERALDGDPLAIQAVKALGVDKAILEDIRQGKVTRKQAREIMLYNLDEKDDDKTIGMKIAQGLDKVKKTLAKLLEDKEDAPERQDMTIKHFGNKPLPEGVKAPEEDWDNPTDYEEPEVKKGKLEQVKDTLKGVGKTLKGVPGKVGKAIKGLPGKISGAVGKQYNYEMKLKVVKWKFIKVVKDAVKYGGETRRGNWVANRILSSDSDADEQFGRVKELLFKNDLFKDNPKLQEQLVTQLLAIMQTELSLKQKYKIKPEKGEKGDKYNPY